MLHIFTRYPSKTGQHCFFEFIYFQELGDERAEVKSLVCLAALACEEQNFAQALILLDKIQTPKGDHDFWYHLTLTRVTAVVGLRDEASQTKVMKRPMD